MLHTPEVLYLDLSELEAHTSITVSDTVFH